jgi:predicted GNAT superfamily acetyltransferase
VASDDVLGVVGFYTLNVCSLVGGSLPHDVLHKLPKYSEFPGVFVGRLARDNRVKGQGLGERLMIDIFRRVKRINEEAAVSFIVLDSKNDDATAFYKRFGFRPLTTDTNRLFVSFSTVAKAYADSIDVI